MELKRQHIEFFQDCYVVNFVSLLRGGLGLILRSVAKQRFLGNSESCIGSLLTFLSWKSELIYISYSVSCTI